MDIITWYNTYGAWYHDPTTSATSDNGNNYYHWRSNNYSCFKFPPDCKIPLRLLSDTGTCDLDYGFDTSHQYSTQRQGEGNLYLDFGWSHNASYTGATTTYTGYARNNSFHGLWEPRYNCSASSPIGSRLGSSDENTAITSIAQASKFNGFYIKDGANGSYNSDTTFCFSMTLYYIPK